MAKPMNDKKQQSWIMFCYWFSHSYQGFLGQR